MWANYLARERPLRAARNGGGGNLGHAMLKTFISGFSSGQQFKSCSRVRSVNYVNVLFVFEDIILLTKIFLFKRNTTCDQMRFE
jgi:hypothetical protein